MNTASRLMIALGLLTATIGGAFVASNAEAQDVQVTGPLAGAPAVRHMRIYREGRFQLQPTLGFTLNDEFVRSMMVGVQAGYHFTDWLGIHAFFNYTAVPLDTDLTDQISSRGQSTENNRLSLPTATNFKKQVGHINYLAGVQATFIPLRGKLAMFQALFVDTDFYIFAGAAFAGVEERADVKTSSNGFTACTSPEYANPGSGLRTACEATQKARSSRMAIAPTFGVGLSMYFTDYMALTLEYRAFPFKWNTSGTDEGGRSKNRQLDANGEFPDGAITDADRTFQFNQMFGLGLAFYLPTKSDLTE
jgi:outer membrane beta-barrel protein